MIFSVWHKEILKTSLLKIAAKYQYHLELSGFGLICFLVVTMKCLPLYCTAWSFLERFFFFKKIYKTARSCLHTPNEDPTSWQRKWHFLQCQPLCHSHQSGCLLSSFCFSFESRNTYSLESHEFNMLKMFLLKSQLSGFYSFGVLSLTT